MRASPVTPGAHTPTSRWPHASLTPDKKRAPLRDVLGGVIAQGLGQETCEVCILPGANQELTSAH